MKTSKLHITAILSLLLVAGALIGCSSLGDGFLFPEDQTTVRFLFGLNDDMSVAAFKVNQNTGALTAVAGSPFDSNTCCSGTLDVTRDGTFVFVAGGEGGGVAVLSVNQSTGALTPVAGSPFDIGSCPRDVKVSNSGKWLFVSDQCSHQLFVFAVGADGTLTAATGSPYAGGARPWGLAIDPQDHFVFMTDKTDDSIRSYAINTSTGQLTQAAGSPVTAGNGGGLRFPVTDHGGRFLYATDANLDEVYAFTISQTDGSLTVVDEFGTGCGPVGIAAHPSFDLIATANFCFDEGSNDPTSVSVFSITAGTGGLTDVPGSPFPLDDAVHHLAFDPSGRFLYLAEPAAGDGSGLIRGYTVDAAGNPVELPGSPFSGGLSSANWIAVSR
jgi:6-phosphogluconolactonase